MNNHLDKLLNSWDESLSHGITPQITKKTLAVVRGRVVCEEADIKNHKEWVAAQNCLARIKKRLERMEKSSKLNPNTVRKMINDIEENHAGS